MFYRLTSQKRPPEGAVGQCHWLFEPMAQPMAYPAAQSRLGSGRRKQGGHPRVMRL